MEQVKILGTDQELFVETLDNGLKVVLIPYENKNKYYASYTTKYGSVNLEFFDKNKKLVSTNKGIAHFLEHKLFEVESGEDPFTFFSKTGTGCNAGTSYNKTSYYIYGINDLKKNLDFLIDFVNTPYFTDENVEKEKGIIIEEIKMYDDNPDWIITEEIQKSTFKNHPIRFDIAGYEDTVSAITKEELYQCYNMFYQPSNMILVVSGNFNIDEIMELIKNNKTLSLRTDKTKINTKKIKEPCTIINEFKEIKHPSIVVPKIAVDIKLSLDNIKDRYNYYLYVNALISILFGSCSTFKEEMLKKGYITYLNVGRMIVDDYLLLEFFAEGNKYKEFIEELKKCLLCTKITKEEFERYKKVLIASIVIATDNVDEMASEIVEDYITWGKVIPNKTELVRNMDFKEFEKIRKNIDFSNIATVILSPGK